MTDDRATQSGLPSSELGSSAAAPQRQAQTAEAILPPSTPKNPLADRNCVTCGLSLGDRSIKEHCPVCDTPIEACLVHNVIRDSDRRWLMRIAWGARVLLMAMTLSLIFYFIELHAEEFSAWRVSIESILAVGSMTAGAWLTLEPEPNVWKDRHEWGRQFARVIVVLAAIQLFADTAWIDLTKGVPNRGMILEFLIFQVLWIVGVSIHFDYLRWMLGRKQRNALRDMADFVKTAITVPWAVILFVALLLIAPGSLIRGGIGERLLSVFAAIVQFVLIAGAVLYGIFLFSLQYVFARAARESDEQFETRIA